MKILVLNCGSSSLKYQLIDMENEKVIAKGYFERIGNYDSFVTHKVNGEKYRYDVTLLSLTTPAISSIQIAAVEMGTLAGKILEKRILDPSYDKGKTYRLPGKLMLRETTAVPGQ